MAIKLRWSKRAKKNYNAILLYLELHFGEQTKEVFLRKSFAIIEILQEFPEIGTVEIRKKNIRGFLVTSHTKLFYRYNDNEIVLLNFFDTRQDPKKKIF